MYIPNILNEFSETLAAISTQLKVNAYLVGGGLRDAIIGRKPCDFDFVLSGAEEVFPQVFAEKTKGSFFWLDRSRLQARVIIKKGSNITTFDFSPIRGSNIEDDLLLRDFTINAIAMPVSSEKFILIDPYSGRSDIQKGIIKACSGHAFEMDPLRLLRAFRFEATLGFCIEPATWRKICEKALLVKNVAKERIRDEFFRILATKNAAKSLGKLHESGLLESILASDLPCLKNFEECINNAYEVEQIFQDIDVYFPEKAGDIEKYFLNEVEAGVNYGSLLKLDAFLRAAKDESGMTEAIASMFKLGCKAYDFLDILARGKSSFFSQSVVCLTKRSLYRFFKDQTPAGPAVLVNAFIRKILSEELCREMLNYYFDEYDDQQVENLLTGQEIMEILGVTPGKQVGEILKRLRYAESVGLINSKAEAREYIGKNLLTKDGTVI